MKVELSNATCLTKFTHAGTFARVSLARDKMTRDYFALKVLAIQDIIKLKQVDHVKNEKMILSVKYCKGNGFYMQSV